MDDANERTADLAARTTRFAWHFNVSRQNLLRTIFRETDDEPCELPEIAWDDLDSMTFGDVNSYYDCLELRRLVPEVAPVNKALFHVECMQRAYTWLDHYRDWCRFDPRDIAHRVKDAALRCSPVAEGQCPPLPTDPVMLPAEAVSVLDGFLQSLNRVMRNIVDDIRPRLLGSHGSLAHLIVLLNDELVDADRPDDRFDRLVDMIVRWHRLIPVANDVVFYLEDRDHDMRLLRQLVAERKRALIPDALEMLRDIASREALQADQPTARGAAKDQLPDGDAEMPAAAIQLGAVDDGFESRVLTKSEYKVVTYLRTRQTFTTRDNIASGAGISRENASNALASLGSNKMAERRGKRGGYKLTTSYRAWLKDHPLENPDQP